MAARIAGEDSPSGRINLAESAPSETSYSDAAPEFEPVLPPILSIESITFSENVLDAEETTQIEITLENTGPGDAKDVSIEISG